MKSYDEQEAVKFVSNYASAAFDGQIDDDLVYEIIDITFDFFDELDDDDDFEITVTNAEVVRDANFERLLAYAQHQLRKGGIEVSNEQAASIIAGELLYEETLDD